MEEKDINNNITFESLINLTQEIDRGDKEALETDRYFAKLHLELVDELTKHSKLPLPDCSFFVRWIRWRRAEQILVQWAFAKKSEKKKKKFLEALTKYCKAVINCNF